MHTYTFQRSLLAVSLLMAGLLLAACGGHSQQPVPVYVTTTSQPVTPIAAAATPSPAASAPGSTPSPVPPSDTPDASATVTPSQAATASATLTPTTPVTIRPATVTPTATATPTFPPDVVYGPLFGSGQAAAPGATVVQPTPVPGVTYGPIVGPGHTLVPTETYMPTPIPTAVATAGPTPTPGPALRRDLLGIQIHPHINSSEFDGVMNYAQQLGVKWVKYQFNWSLLESSPGQYTELFYILRSYVQKTHDRGFSVLISVAKAPGWARSTDADGVMREDGPPNDPTALANFLSGLLNQIGADASGAPYISAIEVWNEPNLQREWHGNPITGGDYMRYFGPAYDAIRAYSSAITIITAGPAPTGDSDGSTNDRIWLQQLYNAGLAAYGQNIVVGIHPYGWANAPDARCCANPSRGWDDQPQFFFLNTIEDYRNIMTANGHGAAQMWGTEFGWATFDGMLTSNGTRPADPSDTPYFSFIDRWQQADYTLRAFYLAEEYSYLGPMFLWNLNFSLIPGAVDNSNPQTAYSVLDSEWNPRPVYQIIQQTAKN